MLGSKSAEQSGEGGTLDAIKNLVQKLPLAKRSSLNSLLAAQLKSGGAACTSTLSPILSDCALVHRG